jgi:hypothetical protein
VIKVIVINLNYNSKMGNVNVSFIDHYDFQQAYLPTTQEERIVLPVASANHAETLESVQY